jgi:hypothetical protein
LKFTTNKNTFAHPPTVSSKCHNSLFVLHGLKSEHSQSGPMVLSGVHTGSTYEARLTRKQCGRLEADITQEMRNSVPYSTVL